MTASAALRPRQRLARFELLRELGRGAQAVVWLAHDPLLEREVALKLLDPGDDTSPVDEWLLEARAVSRLSHAHIVPVFEADVDRARTGQAYLVFEYVDGPTLGDERRRKPRWDPRDAVRLMLGVLEALAAAHEQGIVHRDLKPSNVLLGRDGRPRVMDFGIAARMTDAADGSIVGTPGYMSPEAARGEAPQPAMDVFAAGMMLGELLAGVPLLREHNPWRAVERVQQEDLQLPADLQVDDTLRGVVQRAIARDPGQRYDSARALHAALAAWLEPADAAPPAATHGTLEFLLRRMRHKTDFPALSDSIVRIQRIAASETASTAALAEAILRDVALTHKLLRMVNSVHFTVVTGEPITTVSRAVQLVGFAGIRNMALAVLLLEHMTDRAHVAQLKEEFLRALMAGAVAAELAPVPRDSETAFLGSMFQNLGRLLTEYYFREEALQIRQQLQAGDDGPEARNAAALRVLGIDLHELGAGVARAWGLPDELLTAMRPPPGEPPRRALPPGVERLRWVGRVANGLTDALLASEAAPSPERLLALSLRFAPALDMVPERIAGAAQAARGRLAEMTGALGLQMPQGEPARRLPAEPTVEIGRRGAPPGAASVPAIPGAAASLADAVLAPALEQASEALDDRSLCLNELLVLVLDAMHRGLALRSVVFCLRDPASGQVTGRFAIGEARASRFRFTPQIGGDLFATLCAKGADTLIADARSVAARLPAWYLRDVNAPTFLLLPLMARGAALGLIYADKPAANSLLPSERELALLRALRDRLQTALTRSA
jgi:eukaryotic-like serine/threonine-protein kinase